MLLAVAALAAAAFSFRTAVGAYWRWRSDNPLRRGVALAAESGCFSCHGDRGGAGVPVPGRDEGVPAWNGGVWMMYVGSDEEIRRYIVEGSPPDRPKHALSMPAYGNALSSRQVDDLTAAFKVLSGMVGPPRGSAARDGYELARTWGCFACHGVAGSGGRPNPGSWTGFVPGWYGADFEDLVRDRGEFDLWIRAGAIPRLAEHPIAKRYLERQRLPMPAYPDFTSDELDALWAYASWLAETEGGHRGEILGW